MKTLTTIFLSLITLVASAKENVTLEMNAANITKETSLTTGITDNNVVVNWSSKNEVSNSRYEIERSFYSNNFNTIATIQVPFATNNTVKNYRINDNAAELAGRAIAYYRVKQIDAKGNVSYSNVTVVNLQNEKNNANNTVTLSNTAIRFTATQNATAVIKMKSITGQVTIVKNVTVTKGMNTVALNNASLAKGIYVTEVMVNGIVIDNQKVIAE